MNTFGCLPLQESMTQCGAGKHDQWWGHKTVLVVNHGVIKSISRLTVAIHLMIKFDVAKPPDCFRQELKWTLAIH